jgi:hypothetical protein
VRRRREPCELSSSRPGDRHLDVIILVTQIVCTHAGFHHENIKPIPVTPHKIEPIVH